MDHKPFEPNPPYPNETPPEKSAPQPDLFASAPVPPPQADGTYHQVGGAFSTEKPYIAPPVPPTGGYAETPQGFGAAWGAPPPPPQRKKRRGGLIALLCVAVLLVGLVGGYFAFTLLGQGVFGVPRGGEKTPSEQTVPENPVDYSNISFDPVYGDDEAVFSQAEIYKNSVNGIVGITTEFSSKNVFGQQSSYAVSGTGFVFSTDGYILTNSHLVSEATSIVVTTYDKKEYKATLIGKDSNNDVAVLKIEAEGLTALPMGVSADLVVGEEIVVIGNPLGELTYTLTHGVVSSLSREIMTTQSDVAINMFQTDVAINGGNSGGPAIDCHGNVVGMVSAKYASAEIEGLGFCIPIDDALETAKSLMEHGYVKGRAYLGLSNYQAVAGRAGGEYITGVQVYSVVNGSCADQAGIRSGDIITKFADKEVASASDLRTAIGRCKAGETVELTIYRSGEFIKVTVVLDEATA